MVAVGPWLNTGISAVVAIFTKLSHRLGLVYIIPSGLESVGASGATFNFQLHAKTASATFFPGGKGQTEF